MKAPNVISFNYILKDGEGNFIESTDGAAVSIIEGKSGLFRSVETVLIGASVGEKRSVSVPAEEGYGKHDPSLMVKIARSDLPDNIMPGESVQVETEDGQIRELRLVRFFGEDAILDGNHPLAGVDLKFELEVTRKRLATMKELNSGVINQAT